MKTGIVFEGGAFRTIYSCGIMDALIEEEIYADYVVGVSAGAAYAASYVSKQKGRNLDIVLTYANDRRYMGFGNMLNPKNKSYYGLQFAFDRIPNELKPIDYEEYAKYPGKFYAAVTNVRTGKAEYMDCSDISKHYEIFQATCALPILFPIINIDGEGYLDGGIADSIPVEEALRQGCDKVIVVLTRQPGYTKGYSKSIDIAVKKYRKYPEFCEAMKTRHIRYNETLKQLEQLEKEGKVMVFRPKHTDGFSKMERNLSKIQALYDDGYQQGREKMEEIKKFFS